MVNTNYKGIIEYFRLTKEIHKGPYSDSERIPVMSVGIRNGQEIRKFEIPMDIPNNPFSVRLMESELIGQEVSYERKFVNTHMSGPTWNFQVHSGKFEGVHYKLEELTDW